MTIHDFSELQGRIYDLYNDGDFAEALAELNRHTAHFPLHQDTITLWKACLAALTGQASLGRWFLEEGIAAGQWWAAQTLRQPDLGLLQGDPDFERIVETCARNQQAADRNATPMRLVSEPDVTPPWPALVALHGASWASGVAFARNFRAAIAAGWLLSAPQSTQSSGPERYGWMDRERAIREVEAHLLQLARGARTDPNRIVLCGFSAGAKLALALPARISTSIKGVIAIVPAIDPSDESIPQQAQSLTAKTNRLVLVSGRRDLHRGIGVERFAKEFEASGGTCKLHIEDSLTHEFPKSFDQLLPELLEFIEA
ncbi:MAG: alpha/beta hydrolase [Actinomycetota bacterium]